MREREHERDLSLAWHVEAFARAKRLKKLSEYLRKADDDGSRGGTALLAALQGLQAAGVPMKIKPIERKN